MALLDSRAALDAEDEELNRCEVWSVSQVNVRTSGRCNSASLRCHIRRPRRLQGGMLWPWMARAQNCKDSAQALILAGADASLKDAETENRPGGASLWACGLRRALWGPSAAKHNSSFTFQLEESLSSPSLQSLFACTQVRKNQSVQPIPVPFCWG